jgi:hypothetical protein
VKERDDLMSATRYAVMMLRNAKTLDHYDCLDRDIVYWNLGLYENARDHAGRAALMDFAIRTGGAVFVVRGFAGTPTRGLSILVRTRRSH